MARSMWKGAINFGLVHIPIRLHKATRPKDVKFRELHKTDLSPLQRKIFCPIEGKEVSRDEIVKGYPLGGDQYVVVDPEEIEALEPENQHSIDIENFVELAEVDPVYYETAYYLAPEKGSTRPYGLLHAAMEESGKAAIARVVMRTKEHLVLLRPYENAIAMSTLYYADEVMGLEEVGNLPQDIKPAQQELNMAVQLISSMSVDFDPEKYHDEFREKVLDLVERKAKGQKIKTAIPEAKPAKVIDLVSALRASLSGAGVDVADEDEGGEEEAKPAAKSKAKKPAAKKAAATKKRKVA